MFNFKNYIKTIVKEVILELQDDKEYTYEKVVIPVEHPKNTKQQLTKFFNAAAETNYIKIYIRYVNDNFYEQQIEVRGKTISEFFRLLKSTKLPEKILSAEFHIRGYAKDKDEIGEYINYKNISSKDFTRIFNDMEQFLTMRFPEIFI
jgi:hypothetical protein